MVIGEALPAWEEIIMLCSFRGRDRILNTEVLK
jgi:hypothetical protein